MEALRKELTDKGGTKDDWDYALLRGVPPGDQNWVEAKVMKEEALEFAHRVMVQGMMVEYECYDSRGAPQGRAITRLQDWVEYASGLVRAEHTVASDPYYEWYGSHDLAGENGVYRVCNGSRRSCRARLPRGDRRELVHMEKWRVTTPLAMMEAPYSAEMGRQSVQRWVDSFSPKVPEPAAPPVGRPATGRGQDDPTGADDALRELEAAVEVEECRAWQEP